MFCALVRRLLLIMAASYFVMLHITATHYGRLCYGVTIVKLLVAKFKQVFSTHYHVIII